VRPSSRTDRIRLRGIGSGLLHYDHIRIVSTRPVGALKMRLPLVQLRKLSHSFEITRYKGKDPRLRSNIDMVAPKRMALALLSRHTADLANHRVTKAEVSIDQSAPVIEAADKTMRAVVSRIDKPWHQRGHLRTIHKPYDRPPPGRIAELPMIYYEERRATVALKCYARHTKLPSGQFGGLCVHLEWTLTGKRALKRHLGGNQIKNLLTANLREFVKRNLRLVHVDYVAFGKLFMRPRSMLSASATSADPLNPYCDPDYRAWRTAFLILRWLANREKRKFADEDQALWICKSSPAQIRGFCLEERDRSLKRRRGRPRRYEARRQTLTDYKIRACFPRV
jgi:hypothetical protein